MQPLDPKNPSHIESIAHIWNAACGDDLAINEKFVLNNTRPNTDVTQEGRIATKGGRAVGFAYARADMKSRLGWIEAIAVLPEYQNLDVGSGLMLGLEQWVRSQGCTRLRIGGGLRPFAPGVPAQLNSEVFFEKQGFKKTTTDWDVAMNLKDYAPPPQLSRGESRIAPAHQEDVEAILEFFTRSFSGRWKYEFEEMVRDGGRIEDYLLLWTERGVDGFIQLTFEEGSYRPIERFYMHRLPHPWGQAGPLGVSGDLRGKGYGLAIIDAGLRHLKERGVQGCVIDWTSLTDLYGKFGFEKYREYTNMMKTLE